MTTTILIIIITCLVSLIGFNNYTFFDQLKHYPSIEYQDKSYYRWLTSGFLHGDMMHLFVNMYVFYIFGTYVEMFIKSSSLGAYGGIIYLVLYLLIIVMANIPTYFKYKNVTFFSSVGASGGVTGLVFIYILLNPWNMLYLFFAIPIPAIVFGVLYLWYSSWSADKNRDNIDHYGHFFGALAGMAAFIVLYPKVFPAFVEQLVHNFPL